MVAAFKYPAPALTNDFVFVDAANAELDSAALQSAINNAAATRWGANIPAFAEARVINVGGTGDRDDAAVFEYRTRVVGGVSGYVWRWRDALPESDTAVVDAELRFTMADGDYRAKDGYRYWSAASEAIRASVPGERVISPTGVEYALSETRVSPTSTGDPDAFSGSLTSSWVRLSNLDVKRDLVLVNGGGNAVDSAALLTLITDVEADRWGVDAAPDYAQAQCYNVGGTGDYDTTPVFELRRHRIGGTVTRVWTLQSGTAAAAAAGGVNGVDGKTILNGSGAPANSLGTNGDFYLDPAASVLYGPKAAGAWPSGISLKGAPGAPGGAGGSLTTGLTPNNTGVDNATELESLIEAGHSAITIPSGVYHTSDFVATLTGHLHLHLADGAVIRTSDATAETDIGIHINVDNYNLTISGPGEIDFDDRCKTGLVLYNNGNNTSRVTLNDGFTVRNCRNGQNESASGNNSPKRNHGIQIRGRNIVRCDKVNVRDITRAPLAGTPGSAGSVGIAVYQDSPDKYPVRVDFIDCEIENVSTEALPASANNFDCDGLLAITVSVNDNGVLAPVDGLVTVRNLNCVNVAGRGVKLQVPRKDIDGVRMSFTKVWMIGIGCMCVGDQLSAPGPMKGLQLAIDYDAVLAETGQNVFGGEYRGMIASVGTGRDYQRAHAPGPIFGCSAEIRGTIPAGSGLECAVGSYNSVALTEPQVLTITDTKILKGPSAGFVRGTRLAASASLTTKCTDCHADQIDMGWLLTSTNANGENQRLILNGCTHEGATPCWGARYNSGGSPVVTWVHVSGSNNRGIKTGIDVGSRTPEGDESGILLRVEFALDPATTEHSTHVNIETTGNRGAGLPSNFGYRLDVINGTKTWVVADYVR